MEFADYFASTNITPNNSIHLSNREPKTNIMINENTLISTAPITESLILWATKKLKSSLSTGHDNIPNSIIKGCINPLLPILKHIFNFSLTHATYPNSWKKALIVPIPKKGNSHSTKSF